MLQLGLKKMMSVFSYSEPHGYSSIVELISLPATSSMEVASQNHLQNPFRPLHVHCHHLLNKFGNFFKRLDSSSYKGLGPNF